jgi:hypothetical protein
LYNSKIENFVIEGFCIIRHVSYSVICMNGFILCHH